jgi:23S rRNA pseudouridine2605 synthase
MKSDREKPFRKRPGRGGGAKVARTKDDAAGGERIAKRLARAGVASRREAETMIAAGRIAVNGKVIDSPALNVTGPDRIEVDGAPIPEIERTRLFLYHKPAGLVTTNRDPQGRRTVFDALPSGLPRLISVGRLDINTEGLLLLTNDGGLSRVLELPATGWLRRYRVRVHGKVDEKALADLSEGIAVDGVYYGAVEASLDRVQGANAWLTIGLREGKNREVKNILAALGLEVTRLIRVSYGPFQLGEIPEGEVLEVRGRTLRDQLGPRLIEQAGANFEAPLATPRKPAGKPEAGKGRDREKTTARKDWHSDRQTARDAALDRLSTRAPRQDSKAAKTDDKPRATAERRSRASNVWMAPGARPVGPKSAAASSTKSPLADPNRRAGKKAGKPAPKAKTGASSKPKPVPKGGGSRRGTSPGGRSNADRRR